MEKLDIHSVAGLTRYAIEEGLISIETPKHRGRAVDPDDSEGSD